MPVATTTKEAPVLEFKAFDGLAATVVEDEPGTVIALVAVTGNTDDGGDIIAPGAFQFKRNPKVVWSHDLKTLVGKVLEYEELAPGDPRLPADLIAKGLGALQFKVAFDLEDPESFKAYRKVVFHEDLGWSIGYETPMDGFKNLPDGRRLLTKIFVWEGSPTTFGMNQEARTMSAKSLIRSTLDRLDLDEAKAKTIETLFESVAGEAGETKSLPALSGSFEETQEAVRGAVRAWAVEVYGEVGPENDWWVSVEGTFDSSVVATIRVYSGEKQTTTYQFPYTIDDDGGVLLGDAQEVDIQATVAPAGSTPTAPETASADLGDMDFKDAQEILASLDTKKGAVLSAANASKLQAAQEAISKVLAAAAKEEESEGEKTAVVAREIVPKGQGETKTVTVPGSASTDPSTGSVPDPDPGTDDEDEDDLVPVSDADLVAMMADAEA